MNETFHENNWIIDQKLDNICTLTKNNNITTQQFKQHLTNEQMETRQITYLIQNKISTNNFYIDGDYIIKFYDLKIYKNVIMI